MNATRSMLVGDRETKQEQEVVGGYNQEAYQCACCLLTVSTPAYASPCLPLMLQGARVCSEAHCWS